MTDVLHASPLSRFPFKASHSHWRDLAIEGREAFVTSLREAEEAGLLDMPEQFAPMLYMGLNRLGLSLTCLARAQGVSSASVSRWMSGCDIPTATTRKRVHGWLRLKAAEQLGLLIRVPS